MPGKPDECGSESARPSSKRENPVAHREEGTSSGNSGAWSSGQSGNSKNGAHLENSDAAKYKTAVRSLFSRVCLIRDRSEMLAFFDFPARALRSSAHVESARECVRHGGTGQRGPKETPVGTARRASHPLYTRRSRNRPSVQKDASGQSTRGLDELSRNASILISRHLLIAS